MKFLYPDYRGVYMNLYVLKFIELHAKKVAFTI